MNIRSLCESKTFLNLYGKNTEYAKSRFERALSSLGRAEADFFSVPGRTEIIGNKSLQSAYADRFSFQSAHTF